MKKYLEETTNVALLTKNFKQVSEELKKRIDMLIDSGCRFTDCFQPIRPANYSNYGTLPLENALQEAIKTNNEELVRYMLEKGDYAKEPSLLSNIIALNTAFPLMHGELSMSIMKVLIEHQTSEGEITLLYLNFSCF